MVMREPWTDADMDKLCDHTVAQGAQLHHEDCLAIRDRIAELEKALAFSAELRSVACKHAVKLYGKIEEARAIARDYRSMCGDEMQPLPWELDWDTGRPKGEVVELSDEEEGEP